MDRYSSTNAMGSKDGGSFDYIMSTPLQETVVDIFQLTNGSTDLAVAFLEGLLAGKLSLELPDDIKTTRWAFENYVELQNKRRLNGGHWLWFGFPLLQVGDMSGSLLAPLWLWPIELKPPAASDRGWVFQLATQAQSIPNPYLDKLLQEKLPQQHQSQRWAGSARETRGMQAFSTLVGGLIEEMGIESPSLSVSISPWRPADLPEVAPMHAVLHWCGLLGLIPPVQANTLAGAFSGEAAAEPLTRSHPFGLLGRDPWQETAMELACRSKTLLVQGPAGSGKSTLLQDALINALSNGERCLVLSACLESLRALQSELIRLGLEKLVLFFNGGADEHTVFLQLLRAAAREKKNKGFGSNGFQQELEQLLTEKAALDVVYRAAEKRILGPYTWTQVVGLYLAAGRTESKALLGSQLNGQDFNLSYDQYSAICEQLSRSQTLYEAVNTLNHPLAVLNAGIFVHQDREEAYTFILQKISEFSSLATDLQHRYILEQNDYGDQLVESYEQFYRRLLSQLSSFRESILVYRRQYGQDPLESTRTTLRLYAGFSEKFRKTLAAKNDIAQRYSALETTLAQHTYFQHSFLPTAERHVLSKLLTDLDKLQQELQQWRDQLSLSVQEELLRLSSKTVHADLPGHAQVAELETQLDLLVEGLNDSGLFQLPLENKNLTLPRRQRFLEEILEKLDRLRYNMRDFDRFFDWQQYWFGLPAETRRIITALVKVKPNNWQAAFSSWYLHHLLLQQAEPALPEKPADLQAFVDKLIVWRRNLIPQILDLWADRRRENLQKLKKENRDLYDWLTSKKDTAKAPAVNAYDAVSADFFPLSLGSPYTAPDLLATAVSYDCLFIDEAHLLSPEQLHFWKNKAARTVMFLNPEAAKPALQQWLRRQAWPAVSLRGNYLSQERPVRVEATVGRYNSRQQINDEEARALLALLNTIDETPHRTLPKVAIAALTRPQRNLIRQYLDRIKRLRLAGVEKVLQLERNGLGVYAPDELHGMHADILILSCTYGLTGAADQLTQDVQELETHYRPGLAALLKSRASRSVIILHSFPEEDLQRLARDPQTTNLRELTRWLLQPEDVTPGIRSDQERGIHPLAGEAAWLIANQVRTDRLAYQTPFGQAVLPMMAAALKGTRTWAVLLNGFLSETPATSYEWEWNLQNALKNSGYEIYPLWAVSWWRKPAQEAARLGALLNAVLEEEE